MNKFIDATYLSALLIFMGFFNLYSYYNYFDINIISYLSTGELLLSFLKISISFVGLTYAFLILFLGALVSIATDKKPKEEISDNKVNFFSIFFFYDSYKNFIEWNKENKFWTGKSIFLNIISIIAMFIGLVCILFFVGYIFYLFLSLEGKYVEPRVNGVVSLGIIWFLIFDDILLRLKSRQIFNNISRFLVIVILAFALIEISNKVKAKQLIRFNGLENISFEFNDKVVESDTNVVFIGRTENYIFLRDLKKQENIIYPKDRIGKITISKKK